jgi:flagellar hook-associated protein 2
MAAERKPEQVLQQEQTNDQAQIAALAQIQTNLASFQSSLQTLNSADQFNTLQANVTNTATGNQVLTASASSTAVAGSYTVEVDQVAQAGAVASQGWADPNTTPIASASGSFKFKVGSGGALTTISIDQTMSLQGLANAINTAHAGVTASVINNGSASNPYRLALTATSSGAANTFQITQNDTNLDFTNKKVGPVYAYASNSYTGNVYTDSGNYYTGTNNQSYLVKVTTAGATTGPLANRAQYEYSTDGGITWSNAITASTGGVDATADITIDSTNNTLYVNGAPVTLTQGAYTGAGLAAQLQTALGSGNSVSYDGSSQKFTITNNTGSAVTFNWSNPGSTAAGVLGYDTVDTTVANGGTDVSTFEAGSFIDGATVANSTNGRVKINFGTTGTLAVGDEFSIDVYNPEMQAAQNAVLKIGNSTITNNSNTISDAISGLTLNLVGAAVGSPVTITVSGSTKTAETNIQAFVTAYNTMIDSLDAQLAYNPKAPTNNPLLGDPTVLGIASMVGNAVTGRIPGLDTSSYTSLSQIGITSDPNTRELSVDTSALESALAANPDSVSKLFVGTATPSNQAISFVSKTASTQPGTYSVYITTAPQQATLLGGQTIASSGVSAAETLQFQYSEDKTASSPTFTDFSVSLSAGAGINTIVNTLNSAFATQNVGLTASDDNGQVMIKSNQYGADQYLKVTSNLGNIAGQIGFNSDGTSASQGADVAGTINGHLAQGLGNQLTSSSGFAEDGLVISVDSTQTGGFGTVTISSGIADQLSSSLTTYTDPTNGILVSQQNSLQDNINTINSEIQAMEVRFTNEEQGLQAKYAQLESTLEQDQLTSQYLNAQLAALTGSSSSSSSTSNALSSLASSAASNSSSGNSSGSGSSNASSSTSSA